MKWLTSAWTRRLVISSLVFLVVIGAASAQQPTQAQIGAIRQACRADYQAYCSSVPTGGSAALACLRQNAQTLSAPCQRAVAAVGGATPSAEGGRTAPAATAAPAAPAVRALPPAPPMSPRQEAMVLRRSCRSDYQAYCGDVPPGGGRIIECLRANAAGLSRQCRSAIASAGQSR